MINFKTGKEGTMRRKWFVFIVVFFVFGLMSVSNVLAQEEKRVIEEELVLKDPTVAREKNWLIGGAYEYWYVGGDYDTVDADGNKVSEGEIKGSMHGGSIYLGYGNLTLSYAYRKGSWDIDRHYIYGNYDSTSDQEQSESEIALRYLFRVSPHFNPYVLVGYNRIKLEETETLTTAGWYWKYKGPGGTVKKYDVTFNAPMVGVGSIFPFNEYIGLRADIRLYYSDATYKRDDGLEVSDTGLGYGATLTGYWNIYKGLNLQVGGKYLRLDGGEMIGWWTKTGVFAMLGYTYRF